MRDVLSVMVLRYDLSWDFFFTAFFHTWLQRTQARMTNQRVELNSVDQIKGFKYAVWREDPNPPHVNPVPEVEQYQVERVIRRQAGRQMLAVRSTDWFRADLIGPDEIVFEYVDKTWPTGLVIDRIIRQRYRKRSETVDSPPPRNDKQTERTAKGFLYDIEVHRHNQPNTKFEIEGVTVEDLMLSTKDYVYLNGVDALQKYCAEGVLRDPNFHFPQFPLRDWIPQSVIKRGIRDVQGKPEDVYDIILRHYPIAASGEEQLGFFTEDSAALSPEFRDFAELQASGVAITDDNNPFIPIHTPLEQRVFDRITGVGVFKDGYQYTIKWKRGRYEETKCDANEIYRLMSLRIRYYHDSGKTRLALPDVVRRFLQLSSPDAIDNHPRPPWPAIDAADGWNPTEPDQDDDDDRRGRRSLRIAQQRARLRSEEERGEERRIELNRSYNQLNEVRRAALDNPNYEPSNPLQAVRAARLRGSTSDTPAPTRDQTDDEPVETNIVINEDGQPEEQEARQASVPPDDESDSDSDSDSDDEPEPLTEDEPDEDVETLRRYLNRKWREICRKIDPNFIPGTEPEHDNPFLYYSPDKLYNYLIEQLGEDGEIGDDETEEPVPISKGLTRRFVASIAHRYRFLKPKRSNISFTEMRALYHGECAQIDLIDLRTSNSANLFYGYIFVMIDVFSRKAYFRPLARKTKEACIEAFLSIVLIDGYRPRYIEHDKEGALTSKLFSQIILDVNTYITQIDFDEQQIMQFVLKVLRDDRFQIPPNPRQQNRIQHLMTPIVARARRGDQFFYFMPEEQQAIIGILTGDAGTTHRPWTSNGGQPVPEPFKIRRKAFLSGDIYMPSVVDRFIRTIRTMFRRFWETNPKEMNQWYPNKLYLKCLEIYNNNYHRTIKTTPNKRARLDTKRESARRVDDLLKARGVVSYIVDADAIAQAEQRALGLRADQRPTPQEIALERFPFRYGDDSRAFKAGQHVLVLNLKAQKDKMRKGFEPSFLPDTFQIVRSKGNGYVVRRLVNGAPVQGESEYQNGYAFKYYQLRLIPANILQKVIRHQHEIGEGRVKPDLIPSYIDGEEGIRWQLGADVVLGHRYTHTEQDREQGKLFASRIQYRVQTSLAVGDAGEIWVHALHFARYKQYKTLREVHTRWYDPSYWINRYGENEPPLYTGVVEMWEPQSRNNEERKTELTRYLEFELEALETINKSTLWEEAAWVTMNAADLGLQITNRDASNNAIPFRLINLNSTQPTDHGSQTTTPS
ncbi:uncharacterized protein BJ171DRAFT_612385 [Polychytrium aggregatum]|uniref:uncharacterized protein n=1 Tax=Polychytrium aggregatum TaxID=110093 RepID=UPI0022FE351E|nr:uncharacterized protein BJ171DRAFT_612385 [Polychytrium aggregatum]KAI9205989.1 hypothetical protein BJ171DRAFT_612385 [Polychytrium aggregatum]